MSLGYAKYSTDEWDTCKQSFSIDPLRIKDIQVYLPIYRLFFNMSTPSSKVMTLNQRYQLMEVMNSIYTNQDTEYHKIGGANRFKVKLWDKKTSTVSHVHSFFKFSPLMDPAKYLVGKYENLQERTPYDIFRLPSWYEGTRQDQSVDEKTSRKVDSPHNTSYVDSFFSYLTSMVKHEHGFLHGIDYYGSFLGIHPKFPFNAFDDIEYLDDSSFFHKHKSMITDGGLEKNQDSMFEVESCIYDYTEENSRRNRKPLTIETGDLVETDVSNVSHVYEEFDNSLFEEIFQDKPTSSNNETILLLWNEDLKNTEQVESKEDNESIESSDSDDEDSVVVDSDKDSQDTSDNGSESSSDSDSSSDSESEDMLGEDEHVWINIRDFPVDVICLESMENTLDSLMEKDEMDTNEWISCLAQVVLQLIAYQSMFQFTHNDLHTNNIMYIHTDKKYLFYKVGGKHYRIPTFGKIYKIIDFGRAIYTYRGVRICSDSYHRRGDASTQYNTEPYFNPDKPRIEPNPAFDLARLGCSLYDHFIESPTEEDKYVAPLERMIIDWCCDDTRKNLLYFSNGEERYPGFKLYKMIARHCSRQIPYQQFTKQRVFQTLVVGKKKIPKNAHIMNLDELPSYQV